MHEAPAAHCVAFVHGEASDTSHPEIASVDASTAVTTVTWVIWVTWETRVTRVTRVTRLTGMTRLFATASFMASGIVTRALERRRQRARVHRPVSRGCSSHRVAVRRGSLAPVAAREC